MAIASFCEAELCIMLVPIIVFARRVVPVEPINVRLVQKPLLVKDFAEPTAFIEVAWERLFEAQLVKWPSRRSSEMFMSFQAQIAGGRRTKVSRKRSPKWRR
jgi:hypothetical protein